MFQNYLKIAFRNLASNKIFSAINIIGLALGMTCCMFIFLWVKDEKAIDNFHADGNNLYTVYQTTKSNGKTDGAYTSPLQVLNGNNYPSFLLDDIKEKVPGIKDQTYYATGYELPWGHPETFQVGDKIVKMEGSRASEDFFKMFSYPLIAGNTSSALNDIKNIAISRKMSEIFFGGPSNAMGKTMRYENKTDFIVTAVFENVPQSSTLQFDFLLSWLAQKKILEWSSNDFQTYIRLSEKANVKNVETAINTLMDTRMEKTPGVKTSIGLQRYSERYLKSVFVNGKPVSGRIEYVHIFTGIAIFILIIACINFMNMATARSVRRAKEVGLRKVVGSTRGQLIVQFYAESLLFCLLAVMVSMILLFTLLPYFNYFTGKHIDFPFQSPSFWFSSAAITLITAILSGSYPALYLSSFKPVLVLKGVLRFTTSALFFRKGLTVFQFTLSVVLLVATIVIVRQINYVQNTNLGYNKENLIYIRVEGELSDKSKYLLFKQQALTMPGISMVDRTSETPQSMQFVAATEAINWEGKGKNDAVGFNPASVGFDFVKLMNLKIKEGRDFSSSNPTDSTDGFMVNEEAVKQMHMKDPIGKWVSAWDKKGHIIGILSDYHTHSFREAILPVIIDVKENLYFGVIVIRTKPGETKQALASLQKLYKEINPKYAFATQFVDEEYRKLYSSELVVSKLSVVFATLAISISCLGLLGLVMFATEQRTKEIGIRKVLGASVTQIVGLLSKEFLKLVMIAIIIASPVAWLAMNKWLQGYIYRVNISGWIFLIAGLSAIAIALTTVSFHAIKAAVANPVKSLRTG